MSPILDTNIIGLDGREITGLRLWFSLVFVCLPFCSCHFRFSYSQERLYLYIFNPEGGGVVVALDKNKARAVVKIS